MYLQAAWLINLFAALNVATGVVQSKTSPTKKRSDFQAFMDEVRTPAEASVFSLFCVDCLTILPFVERKRILASRRPKHFIVRQPGHNVALDTIKWQADNSRHFVIPFRIEAALIDNGSMIKCHLTRTEPVPQRKIPKLLSATIQNKTLPVQYVLVI